MNKEVLLFALILAVPIGVLLLKRWRWTILFVMVLLVYEGALRKWLFPGLQAYIYIAKDFLLLTSYVGFLLDTKKSVIRFPFAKPIAFLMVACSAYFVMLLANPNSPSFLLSLLGLKNYIFYFPLVFIVPHLILDIEHFRRLFKLYMFLMLPALILSFIQFSLPPTHFLNNYVQQSDAVQSITSKFGEGDSRARTASTFSYLAGNVTFTIFMVTLSLTFLIIDNFKLKNNILSYLVFVLSIGGMFTTGSRTGLFALFLITFAFIGFGVVNRFITSRILVRFIAAFGFSSAAILYLAQDAVSSMFIRASRVSDTNTRLWAPLAETYSAFEQAPLGGTGMASTHGGMVTMVLGPNQSFEWLNGVFLELESARVLLETGILGFILYFGMRFMIVIYAFRCAFTFKNKANSLIAFGFGLWFTFHLVLYVATNPTAALFYYFGLGVLFAMHISEYHIAYFKKTQQLSAFQAASSS